MSDKEFDQLFKNRFDEFEVNPSDSVWRGVEKQLGNKKRKGDFPLFWMAAASIVVVLAAGLYMLRPAKTIRLYNGEAEPAVVQATPLPELKKEQPASKKSVVRSQAVVETQVPSVKKRRGKDVRPYQEVAEPEAAEIIRLAGASAKIETSEDLASKEQLINAPAVLEEQKITSLVSDSLPDKPKGVTGKTRIKSVGDLVNFVIAQVDQREDKIIEMTDNDEGTTISGINLGVLKIKTVKRNEPSGFKVNFK